MWQIKNKLLSLLVIIVLFSGCRDIYDQDKYQRPDWLAGKLYTQISTQPELSLFASCLVKTGYDTVLDLTGSYTIYAPTDQAFQEWFTQHPAYNNSIDNIPPEDLEILVETHIIQNAWSKQQMQSLDIYGWIDRDDPNNNQPRGYKRQTIQRDPNKEYWTKSNRGIFQIVDSTETDKSKLVYSRSRKYSPLFFSEYLAINNLTTDDYEFYYERPFESGNIYYGNSKIISPEIFAENGFLYQVDQVVNPLLNGEQILEKTYPGTSYKSFLNLIYLFPDFEADMSATISQADVIDEGNFDTLYNLTYPDIVFNIHEELTGENTSNSALTLRYQNGLMAPSDESFEKFVNEELTGYPKWADFESVPKEIKRIIINSHMTTFPLYPSNMNEGFENGSGDVIVVNEADIRAKFYGSNCSFIGLDKPIVPRAFTSVTGPIYLRPGYSTLLYAIEYSKTLPALKNQNEEYSFYIISDEVLEEDSSLILNWIDAEINKYNFSVVNRSTLLEQNVSQNLLTKRILNQVGTKVPQGIARKEFIENLAGNFIVVNNETGVVTGGRDSKWGYQGTETVEVIPEKIDVESDNGEAYDVNAWFVTTTRDMLTGINAYPHFMDLIKKAELYDEKRFEFTFLTDGEFYTVMIPDALALANSGVDTLPVQELQQFILYHFIKGDLIWTDGSNADGYYRTLRVDESSDELGIKYSSLRLETDYDIINILDDKGEVYCTIPESDGKTNVMVATDLDKGSNSPHDFIVTGVIHEIDSVLIKF